jgi:branched-chain amino acid aminotransferase
MVSSDNIVYLGGRIIPEAEAGISIRDRGFLYGDAVFDATRTFNGHLFKLQEHIDRLYDSLRYLRIDPGINKEEMEHWSRAVVEHNWPLLPSNQDLWVMQRISRGVESSEIDFVPSPTLLIETHAIPFARRAILYQEGIRLVTPTIPRVPPRFISPRAKTHNYLNLILGELEAQASDPEAWAVLLDENGNFTEGRGSNVFFIKDNVLSTPDGQFVLDGITRGIVLSLAANLGLSVEERNIDLFDAYTADEAFLTSTSLCICPVHSVNGTVVNDGVVPGPMTKQLMGAFSDLVGVDFVEQYLSHLPHSG